MAVKHRQRLVCMHGHCHELNANRAANHREPTDFTPFVFPSFLFKHVLGPRLQHAFRPRLPKYFRIKDVMHFRQDWLYADPWRCAALSYKLHFHLLLTKKTKQRDADAALQGQHSCKDTNT